MRRASFVPALGLLVAACGGSGGHVDGPSSKGGIAAERELVLYRDGALVRERYTVQTQVGDTVLPVPLPADVDPGEIDARVVSGNGRVAAITVVDAALRPGDEVDVVSGDRTISGILRDVSPRQLVVESGGEVHLILDARHVIRKHGGGARRIDLAVAAEQAGNAVVEITYVTRRLRWTADYTLVMDPAAKRAELHGALGIDNGTGSSYAGARITLFDIDRPVELSAMDQSVPETPDPAANRKVEDPTKPRAEQPSAKKAAKKKLVETPRTTLPFTVDVVPGEQAVSLLDGAPELAAAQTLVYDPVGEDKNLTGKQPIYDRDYGLERASGSLATAVSQSIDIDLHGGALPTGLPAGVVRLLEREGSGALSPLGESRIFERAGTDTEELAPTTSVAVGRAPLIEGKRFRREYTLDEDGKRLIEEFEIELENHGDRPVEVIVREHMYRGQNWKLVFFSPPPEDVKKEGPQKVALRTTVPAGGTSRVVYRILYYWD